MFRPRAARPSATRHRPALVAGLIALLLTVFVAERTSGQLAAWPGRNRLSSSTTIPSNGYIRTTGLARYTTGWLNTGRRDVDYAVGQLWNGSWNTTPVNAPSKPDGNDPEERARFNRIWAEGSSTFGDTSSALHGLDLEQGYAWVKLTPSAGILDQATLRPLDLLPLAVDLVLTEPVPYVALFADGLADAAPDRADELVAAARAAAGRIRRSPAIWAEMTGPLSRMLTSWLDEEGAARLEIDETVLARATTAALAQSFRPEAAPERTEVLEIAEDVARLVEGVAAIERFRRVIESIFLVKFPFIVSRGTTGGAEGTEIIVWAWSAPDGSSDHVSYAYVHGEDTGDGIPPIRVAYVQAQASGEPTVVVQPLEACHWVTIDVELHEGEWRVPADFAWDPSPLADISPNTDPGRRALAMIRQAHADALGADLQPSVLDCVPVGTAPQSQQPANRTRPGRDRSPAQPDR